MRRILIMVALLSLALASIGSAAEVKMAEVDPGPPDVPSFVGYVADKIVVKFAPGILNRMNKQTAPHGRLGIAEVDRLGAGLGVTAVTPQFPGAKPKKYKGRLVDLAGWHRVKFQTGVDVKAAVQAYKKLPGVIDAQPVAIHAVSLVPNDPLYDYSDDVWDQWYLYPDKLNAPAAWDMETGNPDIIVAVPDTGMRYFHKDLAGSAAPYRAPTASDTNPYSPAEIQGNIWKNPDEVEFPNNDSDEDPFTINGKNYIYPDDWVGWDFVEEAIDPDGDGTCSWFMCWDIWQLIPEEDNYGVDNDPRDFNGHGTHCAGLVAAITNNDYPIAGVAGGWGNGNFGESNDPGGVKVVPLRIGWSIYYWGTEVGLVETSYAAEALYYAAANGVRIASCSWGSSNTGGLGDAVTYFLGSGGLLFKAAGNDGIENPDDYITRTLNTGKDDRIIVVAATDQNNCKASFSNYGDWVDICAPGVNITSLWHNNADPAYDYVARMDGTSMATPIAAAVAALIWSQNPGWSADQVRQQLFDAADDISGSSCNSSYAGKLGVGRVNAANAVGYSPPPANTAPVITITAPADGATFTEGSAIAFTGTADDAEDVDISDSISWTSSIDGDLGSGANVTATLSPGTHTVTAAATDTGGLNSSDTITVIVEATAGDATMHVGDLDGLATPVTDKRGRVKGWKASVTITVHAGDDFPLEGAQVTGTWSGGYTGSFTSPFTNADGKCTVVTGTMNTRKTYVTLTVSGVSKTGYTYVQESNHDPEDDSNGTSITVNKP